MPAIVTSNLVKRYAEVTAVDGVSLEIPEGEVFGLLGPNGAGKTTLISMLSTLVKPTSGTAVVAGRDINREPLEVRRNIGIVFQEPSVDDLLTGRENLYLHSMLYGVPRAEIPGRIDRMLEMVKLTDRAGSLVKTYSGGMRRRLEIARGLIHKPRILFLDEPTLGLDPASRKDVWTYIRGLKEAGDTSLILTTHYMEEAERLCDYIVIIDQGRILREGTLKQLLNNDDGRKIIEFTIEPPYPAPDFLNADAPFPIQWDSKNEKGIIALTRMETELPEFLHFLKSKNLRLKNLECRKKTLDDLFTSMTGRRLHE